MNDILSQNLAAKERMQLINSIELRGIARSYMQGGNQLDIFKDYSLDVGPGEVVGLVGPSGAGKSSLLHIAGLLEKPDEGAVLIGGRDVSEMDDRRRTRLRRFGIGFIYQFHHLLSEFTALENVMMPQLLAGVKKNQARARAGHLLGQMGLGERLEHLPAELSGGEQQRVAIARALSNEPRILLADEPTGNLDPKTSKRVFADLLALAKKEGLSALIATHNMELTRQMDRVYVMDKGTLVAYTVDKVGR